MGAFAHMDFRCDYGRCVFCYPGWQMCIRDSISFVLAQEAQKLFIRHGCFSFSFAGFPLYGAAPVWGCLLYTSTERSSCFADHIIAHNGDAIVGAAYAVVEVPFAAQVGAPVGEKLHILPLYLFPNRLPLRFRVVQGDLRPYHLLAGRCV